jgi:hypothetical protein
LHGKPIFKEHLTWCDRGHFSKNGFSIVVTLLNGVSRGESYSINPGNLTPLQVSDFLDANTEGFPWYEVASNAIPKDMAHPNKQMWRRQNGSTATLLGNSIEFKSIFLIIAEEDANHSPPAPATQGF